MWLDAQSWPDCRVYAEAAETVYRHPYNFVVARTRVNLFANWQIRVHLWLPLDTNSLAPSDLAIHRHGWDIHTKVLIGSLTEEVYAVDFDESGFQRLLNVTSDYGPGSSRMTPTQTTVRAQLSNQHTRMHESPVYTIDKSTFHSTQNRMTSLAASVVATEVASESQSQIIAPAKLNSPIEYPRINVSPDEFRQLLSFADEVYESENPLKDTAAAFVFVQRPDKKFALVRSVRDPLTWTPIGGRSERRDSSPRFTAVRELAEELAISIPEHDLVAVGDAPRDIGRGRVYFFHLRVDHDVTLPDSDELVECTWASLEEMRHMALMQATRAQICKLERF